MLRATPSPTAATVLHARTCSTLRSIKNRPPNEIPSWERFAFQQTNKRRDQFLMPRMPSAVPDAAAKPFMEAWVSSWSEARTGIAYLRSDVWAMPLRTDIIHRVFEWQRACARQGTHKTKGRHEVKGGGKKPWAQKGTGRARHGSRRSPIFVGGGRAFPKRNRDYSYKLPWKVQTLGIKTALSDKYRRGALVVMRDLNLESTEPEELKHKLDRLGLGLDKYRGAPLPRACSSPLARSCSSPIARLTLGLASP